MKSGRKQTDGPSEGRPSPCLRQDTVSAPRIESASWICLIDIVIPGHRFQSPPATILPTTSASVSAGLGLDWDCLRSVQGRIGRAGGRRLWASGSRDACSRASLVRGSHDRSGAIEPSSCQGDGAGRLIRSAPDTLGDLMYPRGRGLMPKQRFGIERTLQRSRASRCAGNRSVVSLSLPGRASAVAHEGRP